MRHTHSRTEHASHELEQSDRQTGYSANGAEVRGFDLSTCIVGEEQSES